MKIKITKEIVCECKEYLNKGNKAFCDPVDLAIFSTLGEYYNAKFLPYWVQVRIKIFDLYGEMTPFEFTL